MRTFLGWVAATLVALVALVALITFFNSRDNSNVDPQSATSAGPGEPYTGQPALSPRLKSAVSKGNVVVLYRDAKPPRGTQALVPPGSAQLESVGQAVLLERAPALKAPLTAVSTRKMQQANTPGELQGFIDYWLGGR